LNSEHALIDVIKHILQHLILQVCICEENLCNTFAFLRSQIDDNHQDEHGHRQQHPSALFPNSQHDGMAQRGASGSYHHPMQQQVHEFFYKKKLEKNLG
jgi:hypothetical protein